MVIPDVPRFFRVSSYSNLLRSRILGSNYYFFGMITLDLHLFYPGRKRRTSWIRKEIVSEALPIKFYEEHMI